MNITAKVIQDSLNPHGIRLTTMVLNFPRFILAEFNTHRSFSRNAASSRAVPTERLIEKVVRTPAMPVHWGKNQKGMQAAQELDHESQERMREMWLQTRDLMVEQVHAMLQLEPHKQIINRLLEPWLTVQVVVTATDWENFYQLRDHKDAQPEIQALARAMRKAHSESTPRSLEAGEWHIPFLFEQENGLDLATKLKVSTARCARTSYFYHDGEYSSFEQDLKLHDRLVASEPRHSSPAEHQAEALNSQGYVRNFRGWKQYRVDLERNV